MLAAVLRPNWSHWYGSPLRYRVQWDISIIGQQLALFKKMYFNNNNNNNFIPNAAGFPFYKLAFHVLSALIFESPGPLLFCSHRVFWQPFIIAYWWDPNVSQWTIMTKIIIVEHHVLPGVVSFRNMASIKLIFFNLSLINFCDPAVTFELWTSQYGSFTEASWSLFS